MGLRKGFELRCNECGLPCELDREDCYKCLWKWLKSKLQDQKAELIKLADEKIEDLSPEDKQNDFERGIAFGMRYIKARLRGLK